MTEQTTTINWLDGSRPPKDSFIRIDDQLYAMAVDGEASKPVLWHWCAPAVDMPPCREAVPHWCPWGTGKHLMVSRDPLHFEPSLFWNECCGKHGWVRDGRWTPA